MKFGLKPKPKIKKSIFTFWEPIKKIPGYILLCIKTWKKFLPEYDIQFLDYKRVINLLGNDTFSKIIYKYLSLPIQADAIRVALLKKFGGIWMDPDTIITNREFLTNLENYELAMVGENNMQHIGFIFASNNSKIMNDWLNEIIRRIRSLRQFDNTHKRRKKVIWSFLGNGIIDGLLNQNIYKNKFFRLDKKKLNVFPEKTFFSNTKLNDFQKYQKFYFHNREPKIILENTKGIIMLHNSWTPIKYKTMKENEFLKQNILLSKLLDKILNTN